MAGLGPTELIIILVVVMLLFGATKIPKFARSLGQARGEFEKGMKEGAPKDKDGDKAKDGDKPSDKDKSSD